MVTGASSFFAPGHRTSFLPAIDPRSVGGCQGKALAPCSPTAPRASPLIVSLVSPSTMTRLGMPCTLKRLLSAPLRSRSAKGSASQGMLPWYPAKASSSRSLDTKTTSKSLPAALHSS